MPAECPNIAVVDDDASVCRALLRLLRSAGFAALSYASAEELLATASLEDVGCLILDVHMPGMSGTDLQARLLAQGEQVPIVFITGHEDPAPEALALARGAVAFLAKPLGDEELLAAVGLALARRHRQVGDEPPDSRLGGEPTA